MTTAVIGIIGGTGINRLADRLVEETRISDRVDTPFGAASGAPQFGRVGGRAVIFLARHGQPHRIAPHLINYRANVWLLRELGATAVVATNAVGSIAPVMAPGDLMIPDQIIDYTWGRAHTYMGMGDQPLRHVDFSAPYDAELRSRLVAAGQDLAPQRRVFDAGVYGATQGPRLETAAEIDRMARDGCDVVGMTGMPEASLARELGLPFATVCLAVNRAAGRGDGPLDEEDIGRVAAQGMPLVERLLARCIELM